MITIVNVKTLNAATELCEYVITINDHVLASFTHSRMDGLHVCMTKATEAIKDVPKMILQQPAFLDPRPVTESDIACAKKIIENRERKRFKCLLCGRDKFIEKTA